MGRWRLTPPGYGGTCLPAGRFADLTRHRRVIQYRDPSRGKAWGCGGRSEKRLPWLGQAAASASAPVNVHAVLLTDNGDERLCPREYAANHCRVSRAEEVQKRSFCRRSFPHFFRCWKKWGRRRHVPALGSAKLYPSRLRRATCLPAGRSAGLTRHRRVIQHRGPIKGKAWRLRAGVQRKFTVFLQNLKVELRKASML